MSLRRFRDTIAVSEAAIDEWARKMELDLYLRRALGGNRSGKATVWWASMTKLAGSWGDA